MAGVSGFMAELKRRHVWRVAIAYVVTAWVLLQLASILLPTFGTPAWVLKALVVVFVIFFPLAVLLAWAFEITPEGVRRTEPAQSAEARQAHDTVAVGRKLNTGIIVALVLAVILLLGNQFFWHKGMRGTVAPAPSDAAGATAAHASTAAKPAVTASTVAAPPVPAKSIAVLPFENLSTEKANAYFADGIQDEILTGLAKIGDLRVISRTSTQLYASQPDNIQDIARQLGVAYVLEGSVQRVGDRVRVNVQLITAHSDSHVWAETYDRTLDDVFAVQSEIAQKVASSLQAKLTQDERASLTTRPTASTAAYDAYLRGLALDARGRELATARMSAMAYAEAVRLDPDFALAWVKLTEAASYLYFNGVDPQTWTADYVKHAADTAVRLQPGLAEAQMAQGYYRYRVLRDFGGAAEAFAAVLDKAPNNPNALQYLGLAERREGKWDEALRHLEQAAGHDPRNPGLMTTIGDTLVNMRRYDEDRAWQDRALAISPDSSLATGNKAWSYLVQGRMADAASVLDPVSQVGEDPMIAFMRSYQRLLLRHHDAVISELQPLVAQPFDTLDGWGPQLAINLGYAQRLAGDEAAARATFERMIAEIGPRGADRVDDSLQPPALALAYAGLGDHKRALAQGQRAVELYRSDAIYGPAAEIYLAQVQAMVGDHAAAIAILKHSLGIPGGITLASLQLDPAWDPLRKDPAFRKLIEGDGSARAAGKP